MRNNTVRSNSYSPFRHLGSVLVKKKPVHLTLFLTRRCNAACRFCFYLSANRQTPEEQGELTFSELTKISRSLGNLLWLALSGGEIFLRQDLSQIVGQFYRQNKPAIILLPTNGLLPELILTKTEEIVAQSPRSTVVVKISLDGGPATHDNLRGVNGAYARAMRTFELLGGLQKRYDNFELGINSVFCAANQEEMAATMQRVDGLAGAGTHTVSLIRGRIGQPELKQVDPDLYLKVAGQLEKRSRENLAASYRFFGARLKTAQDILQRQYIHRTMVENKRLLPCYAGRLSLVITENGDLYPCESFDMPMGNLRANGFDLPGLLHSEKGRAQLQRIRQKKCHCTHECAFMMNILFNPRTYPALLRQYLLLSGFRAKDAA